MAKALTKHGKHGTLYRYAIEYGDVGQIRIGIWRTWAYDLEHALERFRDDDVAFVAFRISRLTDAPEYRQTWHTV